MYLEVSNVCEIAKNAFRKCMYSNFEYTFACTCIFMLQFANGVLVRSHGLHVEEHSKPNSL